MAQLVVATPQQVSILWWPQLSSFPSHGGHISAGSQDGICFVHASLWWGGVVQATDEHLGLHSTAEAIRDDLRHLQLLFQESLSLMVPLSYSMPSP